MLLHTNVAAARHQTDPRRIELGSTLPHAGTLAARLPKTQTNIIYVHMYVCKAIYSLAVLVI